MTVNNTTANPGIDSGLFSDIPIGSPFVRASDGRELYKTSTTQALDTETESIVSVTISEAVYFASASGTVEFTRQAPPAPPAP